MTARGGSYVGGPTPMEDTLVRVEIRRKGWWWATLGGVAECGGLRACHSTAAGLGTIGGGCAADVIPDAGRSRAAVSADGEVEDAVVVPAAPVRAAEGSVDSAGLEAMAGLGGCAIKGCGSEAVGAGAGVGAADGGTGGKAAGGGTSAAGATAGAAPANASPPAASCTTGAAAPWAALNWLTMRGPPAACEKRTTPTGVTKEQCVVWTCPLRRACRGISGSAVAAGASGCSCCPPWRWAWTCWCRAAPACARVAARGAAASCRAQRPPVSIDRRGSAMGEAARGAASLGTVRAPAC